MMPRRGFLIAAGTVLPAIWAPARATPADVAAAIHATVGDAKLQQGRLKLDIPVMIENGNAVSLTAEIDALPAEVQAIHVFAEGNPLPNVGHFRFGPRTGRPRIATRIRLSTSQTVIAIAEMTDGSCYTDSVDLYVTLAACLE
jgi:sulfur-oxidizing protein SoxY